MVEFDTLARLADHVGRTLGCSEWRVIDQALIDGFAALTGDNNWYHVDLARAARELPDGKTIAHGLLTLSLVPGLSRQIVTVQRHGLAFNYGLNKVRYPAPVQAGARVRLHMKVLSAESAHGGTLVTRLYTVEIEGVDKPAMVAEMLSLIVHEEARPGA